MTTLFRPTILFAIALMSVLVMMILPVPPFMLDAGLALSFALAILVFIMALFIERPLDFSSFPTLLLIALVLRLALNVSSTKLIIGHGHTGQNAAGSVISAFANFVMQDSFILGVVIFCVLLIVNFMVINKGASRMAEVGARFALDAMPGKQLAIDADVSSGAITHAEASARRQREQAETTFFGSLDGASKFVKGDAVAGLLITALNVVVGLLMGVLEHGMPISRALESYVILTVGDGLVNQIPAVIISVASALLLSRGGGTGSVDVAIMSQIGRYPAAIASVAILMLIFAVVPGLPFIPFMMGAMGLAALAYWSWKNAEHQEAEAETVTTELEKPHQPTIGDVIELDEIHIEFSRSLVAMISDHRVGLDSRISNMRSYIAKEYGMILPEVRITDTDQLSEGEYTIRIHGVRVASGTLIADRLLALIPQELSEIETETVPDPVFGAPAKWIDQSERDDVSMNGYSIVEPAEVLATHLLEVLKSNLGRLFTLKTMQRLLSEMGSVSDGFRAEENRAMIDSIVPDKVPHEYLIAVLRALLSEQVSIRNITMILEGLVVARQSGMNVDAATEYVRQSLGLQITSSIARPDGSLPLVQMAPEWEDVFTAHEIVGENGARDVALPPDDFNRLAGAIAQTLGEVAKDGQVAVITSARRRRFLHTVIQSQGMKNPVISFNELGADSRPAMLGTIAA